MWVLPGRHSLVTPIDWKRAVPRDRAAAECARRHSLVTPIDWKPELLARQCALSNQIGRHSLVTPIDWKRAWWPAA